MFGVYDFSGFEFRKRTPCYETSCDVAVLREVCLIVLSKLITNYLACLLVAQTLRIRE